MATTTATDELQPSSPRKKSSSVVKKIVRLFSGRRMSSPAASPAAAAAPPSFLVDDAWEEKKPLQLSELIVNNSMDAGEAGALPSLDRLGANTTEREHSLSAAFLNFRKEQSDTARARRKSHSGPMEKLRVDEEQQLLDLQSQLDRAFAWAAEMYAELQKMRETQQSQQERLESMPSLAHLHMPPSSSSSVRKFSSSRPAICDFFFQPMLPGLGS